MTSDFLETFYSTKRNLNLFWIFFTRRVKQQHAMGQLARDTAQTDKQTDRQTDRRRHATETCTRPDGHLVKERATFENFQVSSEKKLFFVPAAAAESLIEF